MADEIGGLLCVAGFHELGCFSPVSWWEILQPRQSDSVPCFYKRMTGADGDECLRHTEKRTGEEKTGVKAPSPPVGNESPQRWHSFLLKKSSLKILILSVTQGWKI